MNKGRVSWLPNLFKQDDELTTERSVMLYTIVMIKFVKIKRVVVIILLHYFFGGVVGYEVAETRRKVVGGPDKSAHLFELDVFAVTREYT